MHMFNSIESHHNEDHDDDDEKTKKRKLCKRLGHRVCRDMQVFLRLMLTVQSNTFWQAVTILSMKSVKQKIKLEATEREREREKCVFCSGSFKSVTNQPIHSSLLISFLILKRKQKHGTSARNRVNERERIPAKHKNDRKLNGLSIKLMMQMFERKTKRKIPSCQRRERSEHRHTWVVYVSATGSKRKNETQQIVERYEKCM